MFDWGMTAAILGSSLIGANAQTKAAKMAANAAKGQERNYLKEMRAAISAQEQIQPDLLRLERQYRPEWQSLEADMLRHQTGLTRSIQDELIAGSGNRGLSAMREMSPMYDYAAQEAFGRYRSMLSPKARSLYESMQQKALEEYGMGRGLSVEEETKARQAARQAMEARGMQYSGQAAAMEALMLNEMAVAREQRRRQEAMQMIQMDEAMAQNAWSAYGAPLMQQANFVSPAMSLGLAQQMQASAGPQVFQPESQYSAGVYGANTQNAVSANLAAAQSKAAMGAGLMSMAGQLGGAYLSNENLFMKDRPINLQVATSAQPAQIAQPYTGVGSLNYAPPQNSYPGWTSPYIR